MFRVILLLLTVSNALVLLTAEKTYYDLANAEKHFSDFIQKYDKQYITVAERDKRFHIFQTNLLRINDLNRNNEATFGINKFADLTRQEFEKTHLGFVPSMAMETTKKVSVEKEWIEDSPESLDYREQNLVTEVKDQGMCGSCYVFSAIGNIEGQYAKKHKQLLSLSEQQGLDCDAVDYGCNGGTMVHVMKAIMKKGGSVGEKDYPYKAKKGNCTTDPSKVKVHISNATEIDTSAEDKLQGALAHYGAPLAITLFMPDWEYYQEGVLTPMNCFDNPPNHAVLLVGYGNEPNGRDFWIIKNSWGADWGEDGYFRMEKGGNYCKIGKNYTATVEVV